MSCYAGCSKHNFTCKTYSIWMRQVTTFNIFYDGDANGWLLFIAVLFYVSAKIWTRATFLCVNLCLLYFLMINLYISILMFSIIVFQVISNLAHSIIYTLLSGLLSHFEINTLGKIQHLCQLAESMLKYSNIADDFWKKGLDSGLGILMTAVMDMFPLEFNLLIKLCTALSQAGENSSRKVIQFFEKLPGYTEYLENNMESVVPRTSSWILLEDKKPYGTGEMNIIVKY
ncbi:nucleoporin NUP188 homolog [Centruroides sculpturatus]|uniref:nucleoporin NUP188 homolog n=1 Tax=Centruroides sculpturatus TaxID=218467 RepID=UPI000C6E6B24|nr:nucleoporin NUP188 homolog [Centruroides sculpturatus]